MSRRGEIRKIESEAASHEIRNGPGIWHRQITRVSVYSGYNTNPGNWIIHRLLVNVNGMASE